MGKSVAILGMGGSGIDGFGNTDEVWGINHAYLWGKCDKIFVVDEWEELISLSKAYSANWWEGVKDAEIITKIYYEFGQKGNSIGCSRVPGGIVQDGGILLKTAKVFDIEMTLQYMRTIDLLSTLSYAIAYAINEGVSMIQLWGIEIWEFKGTGAYGYQIQNVGDWLRVAMTRGIKVTVPYQIIPKVMSNQKLH